MKTSIATVSISGSLGEKLKAIAEAGFDGVEIFEQDFIANDRPPKEIGEMVRDFGLEITLFQPFRDFEGLTEPYRQKAFDRARRKFDLMAELGTDLMLVCSSVHPHAVGGIDRAAQDLHELGEEAQKRGLRVGYEALAWGKFVNDHRDAWEIVRRANHPNIGLILDSFHTLSRKIEVESIRAIPGDKIFFLQLADAPLIEMDLLYWSRHFRNMPGEGGLDVTGFTRAVMATGYAGPVSLEIFNDEYRGGRPRLVAADGYRSLVALMDDVRSAEPALNVDLEKFPPRAQCEGVEFVEFTSKGVESAELRQILLALGFEKIGQHRNKHVEAWSQGDIRLLINEESGDFSGAAFDLHGTSVCDIGLGVPNAQNAEARAQALGSNTFTQNQAEDSLKIPAIRGLGGSLLHLIGEREQKDMWKVDFDLGAPKIDGVGLKRIDHIAQTMAYDEMLSWRLFYTSLFEMDVTPMADVIDPDGLVRSNAVIAKNNRVRITLNGAQTQKTLAGKFLSKSFGAPVQHIAFACDDILKTAQNLQNRGFKTLHMNENYYADLEARFDLAPQLLNELKTHHILFDEDENGQFFQFYSQPYYNGFFFEIVERRGDYQGFGAPNAPFRIAAQKRVLGAKGVPSV